ncbi:PREDICTED: protein phosphatase methylesterase 1-like [Papilio polytes]|uniref:protein phosphatase methylesterase 1-like n=1 Tax=Papilio polytes TaxID=76194 RepID=UPI000675FE3E|nr:PREDICTED: protein phosphatase methylesterase 1-like [Papilio polytes]
MSSLQKSIMKSKLPPRVPRSSGIAKLAPFGTSRRKDYSPVSWKQYFDNNVDVETEAGTFRVYMSPEPDHPSRPRIFTLHGGGYSGLSWSLFTEEITNMIHCQVVSMDIRGHGETKVMDPDDLSIETLVRDVEQVIQKLYDEEPPPIILLGHSMGGAIAVRAAHSPVIEPFIHGLAVIDVVEGTAMESLASMQGFLRGRPTHFKSIEHAIEWCIRSGQVRNLESAKVSMPSQILNVQTGKLAINEVDTYKKEDAPRAPEPTRHGPHANCITEESDEESDTSEASEAKLARTNSLNEDKLIRTDSKEDIECSRMDSTSKDTKLIRTDSTNSENEDSALVRLDSSEDAEASNSKLVKTDSTEKDQSATFAVPNAVGDGASMKYKWRIELSRTERHWEGWFGGLSSAFLHTRAPRLLLLASVDGLDRELTVGQMQGKFQMQVLTRCGHAVHEDTPGEVARVVASFILRHRLTTPTENGEHMHLVSAPGC